MGIFVNIWEEVRVVVKFVKVEYEDFFVVFIIDVNRLFWYIYILMKDLSCNIIFNLFGCFKNI